MLEPVGDDAAVVAAAFLDLKTGNTNSRERDRQAFDTAADNALGFTLPHADVPIIKTSNCLMAPSEVELPPPGDEQNCIRCGQCADACPVSLLPQQLYWYSKAGEHDKAQEYHIDDCIECGACAWVCPSSIPLVQYYREEKAELRRLQDEAEQAERAKQRFEAKKQRLEADRISREARHQQASQTRREQLQQQSPDGIDPVAAALARVKARQAELAQRVLRVAALVA